MNTNKQISLILESDANNNRIGTLRIVHKQKDWNHLQRRQQQRAINNAMIKVALLYGRKHFHKKAVIFTLSDRSLQRTPYSKFTDALRGLRVVCTSALPNPQILTTYWHRDTKPRVHFKSTM